jgi:transcriptional regulator with XRE-family HTH domain
MGIMFDMDRIGRKISELRKAKNMTQMELADLMGISFQAVSNWERGNSMPDISKLPELARILESSIDELLSESSGLLKSLAEGRGEEYLESSDMTKEELKQAVPLMKPRQADRIFEKIGPELDLDEIEDLLPFIGGKLIGQLAEKYAQEGNEKALDILLPFLSREAVDGIAEKRVKEGGDIEGLLPFLSRGKIAENAFISYERGGLKEIDSYLPFLPREALDEIAQREFEARGLKHFDQIAPFMNRDKLSDMAREAIQKDGIKAISPIAPFLSRDMLSQYIREKYL